MAEGTPQVPEQESSSYHLGNFFKAVEDYEKSFGLDKSAALETMSDLADSYIGDPAARLALQGAVFGELDDSKSADSFYKSKLRPNALREIHDGAGAITELDRISREHIQGLPAAHTPELRQAHRTRIYAWLESSVTEVGKLPDTAGTNRPFLALLRGIQYGASPSGVRTKSALELKASLNNLD